MSASNVHPSLLLCLPQMWKLSWLCLGAIPLQVSTSSFVPTEHIIQLFNGPGVSHAPFNGPCVSSTPFNGPGVSCTPFNGPGVQQMYKQFCFLLQCINSMVNTHILYGNNDIIYLTFPDLAKIRDKHNKAVALSKKHVTKIRDSMWAEQKLYMMDRNGKPITDVICKFPLMSVICHV